MVLIDYLPYAQLVGQIALVAGAIFAGYQIMQNRAEQSQENSLQVLTRLTTAEFRTAYAQVWALPLDATEEDVRDAGPDVEAAIDTVAMTFEMMGIMVHNRMVPLDIVDQTIGGFLRESWRRSHGHILRQRQQHGNRRIAEWYQWLAERLEVDTRRSQGAYLAFRNWKE